MRQECIEKKDQFMLENKGNFERIYPPERLQDPGEPYELFRRKVNAQAPVDLRKNHSLWRFNRIAHLGEKAGLFEDAQVLEERQTPNVGSKHVYSVSLSRVMRVNNNSAILKSKIDTMQGRKKELNNNSLDRSSSNSSSNIDKKKFQDRFKNLKISASNKLEVPKFLNNTAPGNNDEVKVLPPV